MIHSSSLKAGATDSRRTVSPDRPSSSTITFSRSSRPAAYCSIYDDVSGSFSMIELAIWTFISWYWRPPSTLITRPAKPIWLSMVRPISVWTISKNLSDMGPVSRLSMIAFGVKISRAISAAYPRMTSLAAGLEHPCHLRPRNTFFAPVAGRSSATQPSR